MTNATLIRRSPLATCLAIFGQLANWLAGE
jgi:hypothetical protein